MDHRLIETLRSVLDEPEIVMSRRRIRIHLEGTPIASDCGIVRSTQPMHISQINQGRNELRREIDDTLKVSRRRIEIPELPIHAPHHMKERDVIGIALYGIASQPLRERQITIRLRFDDKLKLAFSLCASTVCGTP